MASRAARLSVLIEPRRTKIKTGRLRCPWVAPLALFDSGGDADLRGLLQGPEFELNFPILVYIHGDLSTRGQLAEQQLVGEGPANCVLNQAGHGTGAHERIKTVLGEIVL